MPIWRVSSSSLGWPIRAPVSVRVVGLHRVHVGLLRRGQNGVVEGHTAKIVIDATADELWAFLDDESNLARLNPNTVEVREIERLPSGGFQYVVVQYHPSGSLETRVRCVVFEPLRRLVWECTPPSGSPYRTILELRSVGGATEVMVEHVDLPREAGMLRYSASQFIGQVRHEFRKSQLGLA